MAEGTAGNKKKYIITAAVVVSVIIVAAGIFVYIKSTGGTTNPTKTNQQ